MVRGRLRQRPPADLQGSFIETGADGILGTPVTHTIHGVHHHFGWDNAMTPVAIVAPGTTIEFECIDASGGQITATSAPAAITALDLSLVNPVTGPIVIDGARPGDALEVTIEAFRPSGFGWTGNIPGFGLLADQFPEPALHVWTYDRYAREPAAFSPKGRVPLKPFAGVLGVAPAQPGNHSVVPPRRVGGNLDIRDLAAGTKLYLPVEVAGAVFSVGDTHAAQGDGEVCGTAIESPMRIALKFEVIRNAGLKMPRFAIPGPVTRHLDRHGYDATTGIGPDLLEGARVAVSGMIELLAARHGLAPIEAYMLCSVCADLRINEIVDRPNWVVSCYFPRQVFE